MLTLMSIRKALIMPLYWAKTSDSGQTTTDIPICCVLDPKSEIYRQDLDLGYISDGPTGVPHENWCSHKKVEGELFYNPSLISEYTDSYGRPYFYIWGVPRSPCYFLLAPGSDHEDYFEYPNWVYGDLTVVRQRHQPWGWDIAAFRVRYDKDRKQPINSHIDVYCWRVKPDGSVLSGHRYYVPSTPRPITEHEVLWMKTACLDFMSCAVFPYQHVYEVHATATHYRGSINLPAPPTCADWGELNFRALADIDAFSSNGIAYLSDMAKFVDTVKDSLALLKGKVDSKSLSSAYLSVKYGWMNTIRDTGELLNALKPRSRKRSTAAVSFSQVPYGTQRNQVTIYYDPRDQLFDDLYEALRYFDLLPSGENLWDLVPMSFVVDWFITIGPILERLDIADRVQHLTLKYGFRTTKTEQDFPAHVVAPGTVGHVAVTHYVRSLSRDFDFPLFVTKDPSYMNHVVEGSALIIQQL